jgi:NAD(P)-dependent dehydrogenase (short-subunit alcohol dehydrogenase family)
MGRLQDKTALITGGSSGIGKATAELFAAEGAQLLLTARSVDKGEATAAAIREAGGRAAFVACDVRRVEECERAVEAALTLYGGIDILFNNAGIVPYGTIEQTTTETWIDTFETNVHGVFYMSRAVLPHMVRAGRGIIINNGSDWAVVGGQGAIAYCASKGAVALMTKAMALDYGRAGIRINAVCPGDTLVDRWREGARFAGEDSFEEHIAKLGAAFPLGRVGSVEEIARAVLFLASDDSSYMTGQLLIVDGGHTAGGTSVRYEA